MTKKTILSSLLTIVLCLVLIAGTTYALFTSEDTLDITVKSATVSLDASIANLATSSLGVDQENNTFANGGGAKFENSTLTLSLMTPGDKVTFNITGANTSTVSAQYRYTIKCVEGTELLRALTITIGENTYNDFASYTSAWDTLVAQADMTSIPVVIEMPETVGNRFQGLESKIEIFVEAVQGNAEETVKLLPDEWDGTASTAWYYGRQTEYVLKTAEDLAGLSKLVAEGTDFTGTTIKLDRDLDLMNLNFAPIGSWATPFSGTFDGQGYTIDNLYINEPTKEEVGLFGTAISATIKGINVHNVNILGYSQIGTIAGLPYTGCTISDCHVTGDVKIVAEYAYAGGIVGYGYVDVDNCSVIANGTGVIKAKERNAVGGIAAWLLEDVSSITNCTVKNLALTGWANIGGLTGFVHYNNVIDGCTVENVVITKTRETGHPSVGIAAGGFSYNENVAITITNNTFKNISLNGTAVAKKSAGYIYGSEYGGADNSYFVLENNTEANIVNNIVYLASSYENLTEGKGKDGTHQLSADITITENSPIHFGAETTNVLDLNGKTITTTTGQYSLGAQQGSTLILTGNGTVDAGKGFYANKNGATIIAQDGTYNFTQSSTLNGMKHNCLAQNDAKIVINGGTYTTDVNDAAIFFATSNAVIEINGGFFENTVDETPDLLNIGTNKYNTNRIIIKGGTFVNYNPLEDRMTYKGEWPANGMDAFAGPWIIIPNGYTVVSETQANGDVWYSVVPA